ncbi:Slp family lipoprotein [Desulfuromonas sp. TF]|uniref:Slp family lipoprotein n=1 Tax=Desulfuromonas sp. TF TaxID=1232410 RepID=UPI0004194975|nr:Slp family lipoprotein [Desulfuromonas sp. TF]
MRLLFLLLTTLFFSAACAPAVSRESMELVDPEFTFEDVIQAPDRHIGRYLLLGGAVVSVRTHNGDRSELEVVQHPSDHRGRITATDRSAGRFILKDDTFRDPNIYRPGRLITVVGQVEGSRTGRIGEFDYLYPVLTVHELRLWAPGDHPDSTRTRFGIGVGIGIGL